MWVLVASWDPTSKASGTTNRLTPVARRGLLSASALLTLLPMAYSAKASLLGANKVAGDFRLVKMLLSPNCGRLSSFLIVL